MTEGGDRLLTGLRLLRESKAPLLVTSGAEVSFNASDPAAPEAESGRRLAMELGAPAERILTNPGSHTTAEEARDIGQPTIGSTLKDLLPDAEALHLSSIALKEQLGLTLYRLRGWS